MLKRPTLLIVGAGASDEFNLPVGSKLASEISEALNINDGFYRRQGERLTGDRQIHDILANRAREEGISADVYRTACHRVRDGIQLSYSIDNFLDKHAAEPKIQLCGRLAIVKRILEAERRSKLFVDPGNIYNTINFQGVADTWIAALFKMLQDKVRVEQVRAFFQDLRIITFNYDRCIEHFFFHALRRNYGIDETAAAEVMRSLEIIHVYGRVGRLPWEHPTAEPQVPFGENERAPLTALWEGIRTYADERDEHVKVSEIQEWVRQSDQTVFLGFSYQEQNLDLLGETPMREAHTLLGSTFGISPFNKAAIEQDLMDRFGRETQVILAEERCSGLLNSYSRMLS